jgi:N-acetylmuramoyl-L-alanine amidase
MNKDIQIIIDPGHGGYEPGAIAFGLKEKDLTLKYAKLLKTRLKKHFENVLMTRTSDIAFDVVPRAQWVARKASEFNGRTICLSCHFNAFNGSARGAETIHSIHSKSDLAEAILTKIAELGIPRRRVFSRSNGNGQDHYAMHMHTGKAQSVIIEPLFLDNAGDYKILQSANFLDRLAEKIEEGLLEHLGIKKEESKKDIAPVDWKLEGLTGLCTAGLLNDFEGWAAKKDEPAPIWMVTTILNRIYQNLKEEK